MSINFTNLVAQGRAKAMGVPWSPEELEALLTLERECNVSRSAAADYIRNGIATVEDYNKAQKVKFVPKTVDEATEEADKALKESGKNAIAEAPSEETEPEAEVEKTSTGKKKTK